MICFQLMRKLLMKYVLATQKSLRLNLTIRFSFIYLNLSVLKKHWIIIGQKYPANCLECTIFLKMVEYMNLKERKSS